MADNRDNERRKNVAGALSIIFTGLKDLLVKSALWSFLVVESEKESERVLKERGKAFLQETKKTEIGQEELDRQSKQIQIFLTNLGYDKSDISKIHVHAGNIAIKLPSNDRAKELLQSLQDVNKYYGGGINSASIKIYSDEPNAVFIMATENVIKFFALVDKGIKVKAAYQNKVDQKVWEQSAARPAVLPTNSTSLQSGPQVPKRKP